MGRWGDGEMGRWGDGEMGSQMRICIKTIRKKVFKDTKLISN
ncbi:MULTISPECIES: hypothetical protein [unclassified Moorena]|nr:MULTISPECIES: hypothetical protein [unclassified Moorena]